MTPGLTLAVLGPKPVEVCQKRARVATRVDTGGKVQYLKDVTDQGSRREAISQQKKPCAFFLSYPCVPSSWCSLDVCW